MASDTQPQDVEIYRKWRSLETWRTYAPSKRGSSHSGPDNCCPVRKWLQYYKIFLFLRKARKPYFYVKSLNFFNVGLLFLKNTKQAKQNAI